jgi:hypothetical protein
VNDDAYHPHFVSKDNDYFQRLMDGAHLAANPYRWLLKTYTAEEERDLYKLWQARLDKVRK